MKMKQLMAAALSAAMVLGGSLTAFAAAPTYTLKSSTEEATGQTAPMETIKIGDDTIQARVLNKTDQLIYSNVKAENMVFSSWEFGVLYPNEEGGYDYGHQNVGPVGELKADQVVPIYDRLKENYYSEIGYTLDECYFVPGIYYAEVGGETDHSGYDYNYVFRFAKDNETTATAQQPKTVQSAWASNAKGWWIENSDGTYLTNAWYQDPTSGLWYYMGADGYMLTNATTPDGLKVDANGVWVQ